VRVLEEADAERREKARIIKRNQRARPPDRVDTQDSASLSFLLPSTSTTFSQKERLESLAQERAAFVAFWQQYPHKVGKPTAQKAFEKACKRAPVPEIMAGLARYAAKTDDRPWCNPATWLNQDRWADQPGPPQASNGNGHAKTGGAPRSFSDERPWLGPLAEQLARSKGR
jgi:hypothetical protein